MSPGINPRSGNGDDHDDPLVSVVVVTWNRRADVLETLGSIYGQCYRNVEVIVVDNGSSDGTEHAIRRAFPEVRLVVLEQNFGAACGRNAGMAKARGDFILFVDSDASPAEAAIANLVRRFKSDSLVGVINSKIVNAGTKRIDGVAGWIYADRVEEDLASEFLSYSFSEGGCAMRKEVLNKVGPFWGKLSFGGEGLDYSLRVWDAGYKVLYFPGSVIYHRVSEQMRVAGAERDCLATKETLYVYLVRLPLWAVCILAPMKVGASLFRASRRGYLSEMVLEVGRLVRELPSLWRERKPIKNRTALYQLRLQREHGPLAWTLASWLKYKA